MPALVDAQCGLELQGAEITFVQPLSRRGDQGRVQSAERFAVPQVERVADGIPRGREIPPLVVIVGFHETPVEYRHIDMSRIAPQHISGIGPEYYLALRDIRGTGFSKCSAQAADVGLHGPAGIS